MEENDKSLITPSVVCACTLSLSDADVEDNLESETSRLQTVSGNYRRSNLPAKAHGTSNDRSSGSNLSHRDRYDSEGEAGRDSVVVEGGDGAVGLEKDLEEKLTLAGDSSVVAGGGGGGSGPLPNADKKTSLLNHVAGKTAKELRRDARYRSKTTLAPRYQPSSKECSVMSCLHQFTAAELLTGSNKVSCKWCTKQRPKNAAPHKGIPFPFHPFCQVAHTAVVSQSCVYTSTHQARAL